MIFFTLTVASFLVVCVHVRFKKLMFLLIFAASGIRISDLFVFFIQVLLAPGYDRQ